MSSVKREFALQPGEPKTLFIQYSQNDFTGKLSNMVVFYKGQQIAKVDTNKEMRNGISVTLPSSDRLSVLIKRNKMWGTDEVKVTLNNAEVEKPAADYKEMVKAGAWALIFIGGLSAVIGFGSEIFEIPLFQEMGIGLGSALASLIYVVLGFVVMSYNWIGFLALIAGISLYALDSVYTFIASVDAGVSPGAGIGLKIVVFVLLIRAISPSWTLARDGSDELEGLGNQKQFLDSPKI